MLTMSRICQIVTILSYLLISTEQQTCSFEANPAQYNAYGSLLRMPYGDLNDTENSEIGFKMGVAGVNASGTIFLLLGAYKYESYDPTPLKWTMTVNVYDSWISYDAGASEWKPKIQNDWAWLGQQMPIIATPEREGMFYYSTIYDGANGVGGIYCFHQCYTQLNDVIYVVAPTVVSNSFGVSQQWPIMAQYTMSGDNPHWINESTFQRDLPNNYWSDSSVNDSFDTVRLYEQGCVTNNDTHIFYLTSAALDYQTLMAYDTVLDEWTLLTPDPWVRCLSACAVDGTGRYLYQFAGTPNYNSRGPTVLETDKYDTFTDSWIRLNESANWPEVFPRTYARAVTDSTTNQVLIFGGSSYDWSNPNYPKFVSVKKVEIFYLNNDTFKTYDDIRDELYLLSSIQNKVHVKVDDFAPAGTQTNKRADVIFLFGGGQLSSYALNSDDSIQFISIFSDREIYKNNSVIIQGEDPESEVIDSATFDAFQRFELKFRVVITEGHPYVLDDTWDITFAIDGVDISDINEKYKDSNTQLLTRPTDVFGEGECERMPNNVIQVTMVQLMIPSRRTLHNGYCPNVTEPWIFKPGTKSNITVIATNGTYTHTQHFAFEFSQLQLVDREFWIETVADGTFFRSGCFFTRNSTEPFAQFEVRCGGYDFPGGAYFSGLSRDRVTGYTQNEIEFNVLMNDVLLAPDAYIRQDHVNGSILGTTTFEDENLIGLVRGRTKIGTWYEECVEINGTEHWLSLDETLNTSVGNITIDDLWDDVIVNLLSPNNEDVVAAFDILQTIIEQDFVPYDEEPSVLISEALNKIISDTDFDQTNIDILTSQLALVNLLTSDIELVEPEIALHISQQWLPSVLLTTVELLNESDSANLADTVQRLGGIANNAVMNIIKIVNNSESLSQTQDVIESLQEMTKIQLTGSWINETVVHIHSGVVTYGIKTNEDECSFGSVSVVIPKNVLHNTPTKLCIITTTEEDNNNAIDLFDGIGTRIFQTNDSCFPFLITMNSGSEDIFQNAIDGNWLNTSGIQYPKCKFWDSGLGKWDGRGCVVYSMDQDTVTCACTHLTTFSISAEHFDPKAQLLSADDFRVLSAENIENHPTTWLTMLLTAVVLIITCVCVPKNNSDKPIIAFEDVIYKDFRDVYIQSHQQWHEIQQINQWYSKIEQVKQEMSEYMYKKSNNQKLDSVSSTLPLQKGFFKKQWKYYCLLSWNLFKTYLYNDHTVLSVFQRTDGTNFSSKQRIGLFLVYMYMIMMADAIFYGNQFDRKPMGDLTASALISLIATIPVFIVRLLFQWSKPRMVPSKYSREQLLIRSDSSEHSAEIETNANSPQSNPITPMSAPPMLQMSPIISMSLDETIDTHSVQTRTRAVTNTYWSMIDELKNASRPDMKLVSKCMNYVNNDAKAQEKIGLASEIRLILYNYNYPFPHWVKKLSWFILCWMCIICFIVCIIYGLQFDVTSSQIEAHNQNQNALLLQINDIESNTNECWNMTNKLVVKHELYKAQILEIQTEQELMEENINTPIYSDDFLSIYDSTKWLLNVLISFLASVILWQPLSIYVLTWIKIWAFHNGLVMEASLYNMCMLLICCCRNCKTKHQKNVDMLTNSAKNNQEKELSDGSAQSASFMKEDRALDVISFLCQDFLFFEIPKDSECGNKQKVAFDEEIHSNDNSEVNEQNAGINILKMIDSEDNSEPDTEFAV